MRIAIYAGSFDPFTKGHLSVLRGALASFNSVIVAVGQNSLKKGLFSTAERMEIIQEYIDGLESVRVLSHQRPPFSIVATFKGLLTDFCTKTMNTVLSNGALPDSVTIVRGLRAVSDLETEMAIADANRRLNPRFQTVFIPTEADLAFVSSSTAREIASHNVGAAQLSHYVIPSVAERLLEKLCPTAP